MQKLAFITRVNKAIESLEKEHYYVCLVLRHTFNNDLKWKSHKIESYYKDIINKVETNTGMFGFIDGNRTKKHKERIASLELFKQTMLNKELYKEL